MARQFVCDFCKKPVDTIVAKYYRAPILPGKAQTSFMASYSHYSDACSVCDGKLLPGMTKRKARNGEGKNTVATTKIKKQATE